MHKLISDKNEREKRVLELMREVGLDIQHVHRFPRGFFRWSKTAYQCGQSVGHESEGNCL